MAGEPYLNIEVDEHSSDVGVITRVEAFVNSLKQAPLQSAESVKIAARTMDHRRVSVKTRLADLKKDSTLYLPHLYPYSEILQSILTRQGLDARVLPRTDRASIDLGKKFTLTSEYFSLTAILGDVLKQLQLNVASGEIGSSAFFIPQNEGAEVDGQYSRFVKTILDEEGFYGVDIFAPFVEDAIFKSQETARLICLGLLTGDIIRAVPACRRQERLADFLSLISKELLDVNTLIKMAKIVRDDQKNICGAKTIMALGDPYILYNDFLNDLIFRQIEDRGYRVIYSPLSEYMWLLWRDFAKQNITKKYQEDRYGLDNFKNDIRTISERLADASPFAARLEDLIVLADKTVGYYAGTNGRYRQAKQLCQPQVFDGVITAFSTYENTGIALGILCRGLDNGKPALNMTFDGNKNENDQAKIDSFIYYL